MVDAGLIKQCADPSLKPAIVEQFIARAGASDPLAVTVHSGNRLVLVPKPTTSDQALALIREHLGRDTIRVGITQYPAGLGIVEAGQLRADLVDPCENIRMGTALFAKVWRIVAKWYGNPSEKEALSQVFDDAIDAWQTGYFEGSAVFRAPDPGAAKLVKPEPASQQETDPPPDQRDDTGDTAVPSDSKEADPNKADIRVNLSGIGGR